MLCSSPTETSAKDRFFTRSCVKSGVLSPCELIRIEAGAGSPAFKLALVRASSFMSKAKGKGDLARCPELSSRTQRCTSESTRPLHGAPAVCIAAGANQTAPRRTHAQAGSPAPSVRRVSSGEDCGRALSGPRQHCASPYGVTLDCTDLMLNVVRMTGSSPGVA